jgi:hypothetical protein
MWREDGSNGSNGMSKLRWQVEVNGVTTRGMPFMAPSVGESSLDIKVNGVSGRHSL